MKNNRKNSGFTLIEMLLAVGILVVLMGIGFVGVQRYQRTMKQRELDEAAQEILIAAQNHLSVADSQGIVQKKAEEAEAGDSETIVGYTFADSKSHFFFVEPNDSLFAFRDSLLYDMLPQLSIDDTVRLGGSYVIEYDLDTATVLNVFYCDQSTLSEHTFTNGDYGTLFGESGYIGDGNSGKRLEGYGSNNAVLGWYGGENAANLKHVNLYAPTVTIHNEDRLYVKVSMPTRAINRIMSDAGSGAKMKLAIIGETSGAGQIFAETTISEFSVNSKLELVGSSANRYQYYVLDDITVSGKSFYAQWCSDIDSAKNLIPGENVQVIATVTGDHEFGMRDNTSNWENSLFGSCEVDTTSGTITNGVANIRHLENLESAISGFEPKEYAKKVYEQKSTGATPTTFELLAQQKGSLQWVDSGGSGSKAFLNRIVPDSKFEQAVQGYSTTDFYSSPDKVKIFDKDGSQITGTGGGALGTYVPVKPSYDGVDSFTYDGNNKKITNVKIDIAGNAGIFSTLPANSEVKNLELIDCNVTSRSALSGGGSAGVLAGEAIGKTTISKVLVRDSDNTAKSKVSAEGNGVAAGGLVGMLTGGVGTTNDTPNGLVTITDCAAAVTVETTGIGSIAGGLVGHAAGNIKIEKSYSGGHTHDGMYSKETFDVMASGNTNAAGGFIGQAMDHVEGGGEGLVSISISECYSSCSVYGTSATGGFIGAIHSGSVRNCYSVGLVNGTGKQTGLSDGGTVSKAAGVFVGTAPSVVEFTNNKYLSTINPGMSGVGTDSNTADNTNAITAFDVDTTSYNAFANGNSAAMPYDDTLSKYYSNKYPYPSKTSFAFDESEIHHYGDWPAPETLVVNEKSTS